MNKAMIRIQVYLEPEIKEKLESLASRCNVSKSELIKKSILKLLQEEVSDEEEPLLGIIGLGKSGVEDVSEQHDIYLSGEK